MLTIGRRRYNLALYWCRWFVVVTVKSSQEAQQPLTLTLLLLLFFLQIIKVLLNNHFRPLPTTNNPSDTSVGDDDRDRDDSSIDRGIFFFLQNQFWICSVWLAQWKGMNPPIWQDCWWLKILTSDRIVRSLEPCSWIINCTLRRVWRSVVDLLY